MAYPLTVASVNIRHGADEKGASSLEVLADRLAELPWQILAVQEMDRCVERSGSIDQLEVLAGQLGAEAHFAESLPLQGGSYGVALLWRDLECSPLPPCVLPSPPPLEPRVACLVELPGGLTVASTHLDCNPEQARRNLELLLESPSRPCLVLGDLNLRPDQLSLPEAWDMAGRNHLTFPSGSPSAWIDHVLYRRDSLVCQDSWTERLPATDHLAFFARLAPVPAYTRLDSLKSYAPATLGAADFLSRRP